jgi:hypothetical protein
MYFLYKNEYRIFKPVETALRKGLMYKGEIERMDQFGLLYIYTWKCHKETPCIDILKKQKCHFFLLQKCGAGGENRSCLGWGWYQWERGGCGEKV